MTVLVFLIEKMLCNQAQDLDTDWPQHVGGQTFSDKQTSLWTTTETRCAWLKGAEDSISDCVWMSQQCNTVTWKHTTSNRTFSHLLYYFCSVVGWSGHVIQSKIWKYFIASQILLRKIAAFTSQNCCILMWETTGLLCIVDSGSNGLMLKWCNVTFLQIW